MKKDHRKARAFTAIMYSKGLEPSGMMVLWLLVVHYNLKTGRCNPSHERLSALGRLNRSTVAAQIKKLRSKGFISRKRTPLSNSYTIHWHELDRVATEFEKTFRGASKVTHSAVDEIFETATSGVSNSLETRRNSKTGISQNNFINTARSAQTRLHEDISKKLSPKVASEIYSLLSPDDEQIAIEAEKRTEGTGYIVAAELARKAKPA